MALNNLTLFCRECFSSWENINPDSGVCNNCDTPNVLTKYDFLVNSDFIGGDFSLSASGYTREEAYVYVLELVETLVNTGQLPVDTEVAE